MNLMGMLSLTCHLYWQLISHPRCADLRELLLLIPPDSFTIGSFSFPSKFSPPHVNSRTVAVSHILLTARYVENSLHTMNRARLNTHGSLHDELLEALNCSFQFEPMFVSGPSFSVPCSGCVR